MSKRVLIILAVGFIAIIAAFFLMKHELDSVGLEYIEETEPEPKVKQSKKAKNEPIKETEPETGTTTEPGTGNETEPGTDEQK